MNEKPTGKASSRKPAKTLTDWKRLRSLSDREIRNAIEKIPEARPTDASFWKKAKVVLPQTQANHYDAAGCGSADLAASAKGVPDADQRYSKNLYGCAKTLTASGRREPPFQTIPHLRRSHHSEKRRSIKTTKTSGKPHRSLVSRTVTPASE